MRLEENLEEVDFKELQNVEPHRGREGTVSYAIYNGKKIVLKESKRWVNYNRDYMVVNHFKDIFGLNKLTMKRVRMNKKCEFLPEKPSHINWIDASNVVYCMMDRVEGKLLELEMEKIKGEILREFIKIGLFRGIFRVSDFRTGNILIENDTDRLFSIDEHYIGRRNCIFLKEIEFIKNNITKELIDDILKDWDAISDIWLCEQMKTKMEEYEYDSYIIQNVINNYKNLKNDVYDELGFNFMI